MTIIEFRMFFEALPGAGQNVKGQLRTQSAFSLACGIPLGYLKGIAKGKNAFSEATINKVLPVMRNYGFKG
jgi:hypothetical protein